MIDLRASPFFLSEESITWVQGALSSMTPEEKIGQLFCITAGGENPQTLGELVQRYQPGGFMFRSAPAAQVLAAYQAMDKASKIHCCFLPIWKPVETGLPPREPILLKRWKSLLLRIQNKPTV